MKQLLIQTRSNEESYGLLYPSMLRLLATHYPHLCLVEDWISEEEHLQISNNRQQTQVVSTSNEQQKQNSGDEEVIRLLRQGSLISIFSSTVKPLLFMAV